MIAPMSGSRAAALAGVVLSMGFAACAPSKPAEPPRPGPLRVIQRLTPVEGVAPFDPLARAAVSPLRWTAAAIERQWTRLGSRARPTYMSPPLDTAFAIVATFPEVKAEAEPALLVWSAGTTLSREDFARNRRELRPSPGTAAAVWPADHLSPEGQPIRHLFVHPPAGTDLAAALDAVSVVTRDDLTTHGAVGPLRLMQDGDLRDVVLAAPAQRVVYEVGQAASRVSFAVHLPHDLATTVRAWQESPAGSREILAEPATGRGWHDFSVPFAASGGSRLAVDVQVASPAAVMWSAPLAMAPDPGATAPHIVLYIVDALRADALGLYGAGGGRSPVLDALGGTGLVFGHAYAAASWTKPSVATILTSLYPATHGLGARYYGDQLPSSVTTLAEVLAAAGYATAQFSANPFTGALSNLDQGFDLTVVAGAPPGGATSGRPPRARDLHERAASWLVRQATTPAFAYIHAVDTHPPFAVPGPTARAAYDASLASVDAEIGELRRRLAAGGLGDNLLFVVTADHGEAFGEHGHDGHGQSVYDEEVRVPLLLHWPGRIAAARIDEPVHHVDLAPTILALAGISADTAGFAGRALWPLAPRPTPSAVVVSRFAYPEDLDATVADRTDAVALVDYPWKLVSIAGRGGQARTELYRLDADPGERRDLAREQPARVRALQRALDQFAAEEQRRHARFVAEHARGRERPPPPARALLDRLRSLGYVR